MGNSAGDWSKATVIRVAAEMYSQHGDLPDKLRSDMWGWNGADAVGSAISEVVAEAEEILLATIRAEAVVAKAQSDPALTPTL